MAPQSNIPPGRKKALVIGIREVQGKAGFGPVHFAHRDARNVADFLIGVFGYKKEDVVLMLDVKGHEKQLLPTRTNILRQIKLLVKDAAENDQFFFYYSGHGTQVTCCHNSEDDGLDEVLLTANGKEIMDNLLKVRLVRPLLDIKNAKLFALFDCCHSASMLDLQCYSQHFTCSSALGHIISGVADGIANIFQRRRTEGALTSRTPVLKRNPRRSLILDNASRDCCITLRRVATPEQEVDLLGREPRVISLSACQDGEIAFDDNERQDTMTKFFISALMENRDLTWLQLRREIRKHVKEISRRRAEQTVVIPTQTSIVASAPDAGHQCSTVTPTLSDGANRSWYYQVPEYSSNKPFNLNDRVDF